MLSAKCLPCGLRRATGFCACQSLGGLGQGFVLRVALRQVVALERLHCTEQGRRAGSRLSRFHVGNSQVALTMSQCLFLADCTLAVDWIA